MEEKTSILDPNDEVTIMIEDGDELLLLEPTSNNDLVADGIIEIEFPSPEYHLKSLFRRFNDDDRNSALDDAGVQCRDGFVSVPRLLLRLMCDFVDDSGQDLVILPDIRKEDFETFLEYVCDLDSGVKFANSERNRLIKDLQILEKIAEMFNAFNANKNKAKNVGGKKRGRKRKQMNEEQKQEEKESYVKLEVTEKMRNNSNYGLRRKIKRKKFADEISDVESDLEDDLEDDQEVYDPDKDVEDDDDDDDLYSDEDLVERESESENEDDLDELDLDLDSDDEFYIYSNPDESGFEISDREKPANANFVGKLIQVEKKKFASKVIFKGKNVKKRRSLLKKNEKSFFCSICEFHASNAVGIKKHALKAHEDESVFYKINKDAEDHRDCGCCDDLMTEFRRKTADKNPDFFVLICPHCKRRFFGDEEIDYFVRHLNSDHKFERIEDKHEYLLEKSGFEWRKCDYCGSEEESINEHLEKCDKNEKKISTRFNCNICGNKNYANVHSITKHYLKHQSRKLKRMFHCQNCQISFFSKATLDQHRCRQESDSSSLIKCQLCGYLFASKNNYFCHMKNRHGEHVAESEPNVKVDYQDKKIECEFCEAEFDSRVAFNDHLLTCRGNPLEKVSFKCEDCESEFGDWKSWKIHRLEDHPKAISECGKCEYSTLNPFKMEKHQKVFHNVKVIMKRCSKCDKGFKSAQILRRHEKKCGLNNLNKVKCTDCSMEFKRKEDMQAHALIHYGQVTCPIHNILFKQESEVFQHVNRADSPKNDPDLVCCMCAKSFKHMCNFMKHMRNHLNIRAYRCGVCQKHFNSYASLKVHQQNLHGIHLVKENKVESAPGDRFVCEQCSRSFNTKGHLKEHMLGVHDTSQSVPCPICEKTYRTEKRMKKHLFNTHKDAADRFRRHVKVETFADLTLQPIALPE